MITQKFRGRNQLVKRLSAQVRSKSLAMNILKKRGQLVNEGDGKFHLTAKGRSRDIMTAAERAKDRQASAQKKPKIDFVYNKVTNTAKLKKGK